LISSCLNVPYSEAALNAALDSNRSSSSSSSSASSLCCVVHSTKGIVSKVKHRYPFSSSLKRMSVIAEVSIPSKGETGLFVFVKGAPEVLAAHLLEVPSFYKETYIHHMTRGKRVLAMAYRQVFSANMSRAQQDLRDAPRSKAESGLTFAGFILFDCDLKADSKSVIKELRSSDHKVIMITGDSSYTAADVAAKLGMTRTGADSGLLNLESLSTEPLKSTVSPSSKGADHGLVWRKVLGTSVPVKGSKAAAAAAAAAVPESKVEIPFNPSKEALKALAAQYSLCVTGPSLVTLLGDLSGADHSTMLKALCPNVTVFARVSPAQKVRVSIMLCSTVFPICLDSSVKSRHCPFLSLPPHSCTLSLSPC
jgi:magnesium-transporting ATPase (P-type)